MTENSEQETDQTLPNRLDRFVMPLIDRLSMNLVDRKWYWVKYHGLGRIYEAPAMYIANCSCFYSYEFSGIPARQVEILREA